MKTIGEYIEKIHFPSGVESTLSSLQKKVTIKAMSLFDIIGEKCSFGPEGVFTKEELVFAVGASFLYCSLTGNPLATPLTVVGYIAAKIAASIILEAVTGEKFNNTTLGTYDRKY